MYRSRYFWKLLSVYGLVTVATAGLTGLLVELRREIPRSIAIAAALGLLLCLVVTWRVAGRLRNVATSAEAIARGAYAQRVPDPSTDELGRLARAFNSMSEELRRSMAMTSADRSKLTAILASMVEGVVAVDRDERVVHMNQVAGRLLGAVPEEVTSRPIWEVTRIREITETLTETLRTENVGHRVVRLPGSTDRVLDLHASPLRAGGDVLAGAVLVLNDVTQLRRLETVRSDFVGNVSHELKTPVTAIRGLVETLLDDPEIDPSLCRRFHEKIRRQAERMSNLVTDLLSLSRLESSESPLELSPLDVRDVLEESIRQLQPTSDARQVEIVSDWGAEPLMVDGEEEHLRQAVGNLLTNAIKYSSPQSSITLRAASDGEEVMIEVQDEGPGIEPRHHNRLFERFYRVDAARSRELGGTGLGLAIVKHTALALGGDVSVASVPEEGSTFSIRLPVSQKTAATLPRAVKGSPS